ncbi:hypothetical protein BJX64DRAFT_54490 [Aspergillus heterothallicus]
MPSSPASSPPTARLVQTAVPPDTIWSRITENDFRHHLVMLETQTNAVPMDVLTADGDDDQPDDSSSPFLPLRTEKQTAEDFAYIAAVTEGAQSVAAVCLEQHVGDSLDTDEPNLVITVAGMDAINENVKAMLHGIVEQLQYRASLENAKDPAESDRTEIIFHLIIQQHEQKLLGRLRSTKWTKPKHLARTHKKSLWQDFENLSHRAQHIYPRKPERKTRDAVTSSIQAICKEYHDFESSTTPNVQALQGLVRETFTWCKSPLIAEYASKLEVAGDTRQVTAALKTLRQLEKIGAYWRIAQDLVAIADQYGHVFRQIHLEYITPYASVPTSIAYESWAHTCHVHAEIQLVAELAKRASKQDCNFSSAQTMRPRTIGTSKYLCYLCYLFLRFNGEFQILSTHGRLYDQWTVPDLAEYNIVTRNRFAAVLESMDSHVVDQIEKTKCVVWRAEPMTSRQNLLLLPAAGNEAESTLQPGTDTLSLT